MFSRRVLSALDSIITLILHICMLPRVLLLHWMPPCLGLVTRDPPPRVEGGLPPPGYSRGLCGLEMLASTLSLGASFPGALGYPKARVEPFESTLCWALRQKAPGVWWAHVSGRLGCAYVSAPVHTCLQEVAFKRKCFG